jgi:cell division protein FtsB
MDIAILIFILILFGGVITGAYIIARQHLLSVVRRKITVQNRRMKRLQAQNDNLNQRLHLLEVTKKDGGTTSNNSTLFSPNKMEDRAEQQLRQIVNVNGKPTRAE